MKSKKIENPDFAAKMSIQKIEVKYPKLKLSCVVPDETALRINENKMKLDNFLLYIEKEDDQNQEIQSTRSLS